MKILLFGKNGQIGWELNRSLQPLGEVIALDREAADFSEPERLREVIRNIKPDVIVNAVAYTAVDRAEKDEDLALLINAVSPKILAEEALRVKALLVHYSTDYVFDGNKCAPYTEDDKPNPLNAYGRTKLEGERLIHSTGCNYLIFRTSWVYSPRGKNFLLTILSLAGEKDSLSIVSDQVGSPTSARLIAESTLLCIQQTMSRINYGDFSSEIYHLTSSGKITWHGFAQMAIKMATESSCFHKKVNSILQIQTSEYKTQAIRPLNSCLSTEKVMREFGIALPKLVVGLRLCIEELYYKHR